jgi:hypothetical protein
VTGRILEMLTHLKIKMTSTKKKTTLKKMKKMKMTSKKLLKDDLKKIKRINLIGCDIIVLNLVSINMCFFITAI